jgi:hypothetical protein
MSGVFPMKLLLDQTLTSFSYLIDIDVFRLCTGQNPVQRGKR